MDSQESDKNDCSNCGSSMHPTRYCRYNVTNSTQRSHRDEINVVLMEDTQAEPAGKYCKNDIEVAFTELSNIAEQRQP